MYFKYNNFKKYFELNTTLTDSEKQEFIELYYNDSQFDLLTAYKLIKYYHNKQGLETKSEATYRRFANFIKKSHYDFDILSRKGEKALKDEVVTPRIGKSTAVLEYQKNNTGVIVVDSIEKTSTRAVLEQIADQLKVYYEHNTSAGQFIENISKKLERK